MKAKDLLRGANYMFKGHIKLRYLDVIRVEGKRYCLFKEYAAFDYRVIDPESFLMNYLYRIN